MFRDAKRVLGAAVVMAGIAASASVGHAADLSDSEAKKFFNAKGCNACHGVAEMRIGPSYEMIATRYAQNARDAVDVLSWKIRYGGAGAWGAVPMISNPRVSQEEAEAAARWILGQYAPGDPRR